MQQNMILIMKTPPLLSTYAEIGTHQTQLRMREYTLGWFGTLEGCRDQSEGDVEQDGKHDVVEV